MNLKRKYENNSCTHGILTIPAYGFKCLTLELGDGDSQDTNGKPRQHIVVGSQGRNCRRNQEIRTQPPLSFINFHQSRQR